MTRDLLFARTRTSRHTLLAVLVAAVVSALLQGHTFIAPIVPWESRVLTTPLLPAVVAIAAMPAFASPMPELESANPAAVARLRTRWAIAWIAMVSLGWSVLVVAGNAVVGDRTSAAAFPAMAAGRNAMFFLALALGSAVLLGADLAWVIPAAAVTSLVFFGRNFDQQPRDWAILLHGPSSVLSWLLAIGLTSVAVIGYRRCDTGGLARTRLGVQK